MSGRSRDRARTRCGGKTPRVLYSFDFTSQSAGAVSLPTGITFARASSGHTVQDGASAIVTAGITSNDVGRVGRLSSAHSYGLYVEPARTNQSARPLDASLLPYGSWASVTTGQTDPAGGTTAVYCTVVSGGVGRYDETGNNTGSMTVSSWIRRGSGSGVYQLVNGSVTTNVARSATAGVEWGRVDLTHSPFAAQHCFYLEMDGRDSTASGGIAAGARQAVLAYRQIENGKYPTSVIWAAGGPVTRAAERLSIDSTRAAASLVGGRLGVYLRLRALAASSELGSGEGRLLGWAAGEVFVDPTSTYIKAIDVAAVSQTANSVISWARGDLLEFAIEVGAGTTAIRWRVNSAAVNTASFSVTNNALAALDLSAGLDVCNNAASAQMPGIVEKVVTFAPGWGPM